MTDKKSSLQAEHKDLVEKRSAMLTRADEIAAMGDTMPADQSAILAGLVTELKNLDARLAKIEEELAMDNANDVAAGEAQPQDRSLPVEVSVRNLPPIPAAPAQPVVRPAQAPAFVRDLNDKRRSKNLDMALRGWALQPTGQVSDQQRQAAKELGFDLNQRSLTFNLFSNPKAELRAVTDPQAAGTGNLGGYTVPTTLIQEVEKYLLYVCPVREVANVIRTTGANPIDVPVVDDTSNTGAILAENTAETVKNVTFSKVTLGGYKYSSGMVLASMELLADTAVNMPALLGELLGTRLAKAQGASFATGNGTSAPQGFITGAGAGVTTAAAAAIAVDDLLGLIHSVDRAYRENGTFVMNDATLLAIRKLKDSTGQPIFTQSYRDGEPDSLLGYPILVDNNVSSATTGGTKGIAFGDFNKFWIRDGLDVTILRSDERYFEYGQSAFVAFARTDSKVINSAAIKVLTYKTP